MTAIIQGNRYRIRESYAAAPSRVDAEAGVIHGVKILGPQSANGRTYTPEAMAQAARLYEGRKVNLDHPSRSEPNKERSVNDWIGVLRNVAVTESGVYGDLHLLKTHPASARILEAAQKFPEQIGLSHNADGRVRREGGQDIVETIESVRSVDLVQDPATVAGLFESIDANDQREKTVAKKTIKQIVESADASAKKLWQYTRLMEMEGDMGMDGAMGAAEVPVEASATSADAVKEAFKAAVIAILDDDALSVDQQKEKIATLMDLKAQAAGDGLTEETEGESSEEEETEMTESKKRKTNPDAKALLERIAKLESERDDAKLTNRCRELLEAAKREVTDVRMTALKRAASDTERASLIESWAPQAEGAPRPERSPSVNDVQGAGKYSATDGKSLLESCRR